MVVYNADHGFTYTSKETKPVEEVIETGRENW